MTSTEAIVRRFWVNKYKRPANDPLFRQRTLASLFLEMYEDLHERRLVLSEELERATGLARLEIERQIADIARVFAETSAEASEDELIAKWERELEAGRMPDLTEGMASAKKSRS